MSWSLYTCILISTPQQGGLLTGEDPTVFTTSDPLKTWIIQLGALPEVVLRHLSLTCI